VSVTEILGFVTGAAAVWLAVRENVWNWPVGIANGVFFLIIFWTARLYANALLQVIYIALGLYGWWNWLRGGSGRTPLRIRQTRVTEAVVLGALTILSAGVLIVVLDRVTDSTVAFWDGATVALSLTATYMMAAKQLHNWWVWIAADVIYIPLYAFTGLYLTSVVYVLFLAMCIVGLVQWAKALNAAEAAESLE